jgi:hypothetical protein
MDTAFWQKIFAFYGHYILADVICSLWTLNFSRSFVFYETAFWQSMIVMDTAFSREMFVLYGHCILAVNVCSLWTL